VSVHHHNEFRPGNHCAGGLLVQNPNDVVILGTGDAEFGRGHEDLGWDSPDREGDRGSSWGVRIGQVTSETEVAGCPSHWARLFVLAEMRGD
jgi:hypothetical protein